MAVYSVTGGAGFIGSHIVQKLVADGHSVRVLDDFSTGKRSNLAAVADDVEVIEADIGDENALERLCRDSRCVFHHAAMASVPLSVEDPAECHRVNAQGTLRLLDAARAAGVRRFVYASTSAIYGNPETLPTDEDSPAMPLSPYAQAKLMGENFCRCHADAYGMQTVCLRYFNVFGPRQDPAGQYAAVVPLFIQKALAGEPVTIFGDGEQTRDFVYVGDVVRANMLAAAADGVFGAICNVARGTRHSINELLDTVRRLTGNDVEATHAPQRPGDVRHSGADISRARRVLGYEPRIPLEEGLRRTIEAFCEDLNE